MIANTHKISYNEGRHGSGLWAETLRQRHGLHCVSDAGKSVGSAVASWPLGDIGMTQARLAAQVLRPVREGDPAWQGMWLYLKYIVSGSLELEQAGRRRQFQAGSLLVIDPARTFIETIPQESQLIAVRLPKARLKSRGLPDAMRCVAAIDPLAPDARMAGALIQSIALNANPVSASFGNMLCDQMLDLLHIILRAPGTAEDEDASTNLRVRLIQQYIRNHLADHDLDIAAIAAANHVSAKHLQRLFRMQNATVMGYVWTARLQRAKQLLDASPQKALPIQQVAWMCGFSSAAHFSRAFKAAWGVSPRDARGETPS